METGNQDQAVNLINNDKDCSIYLTETAGGKEGQVVNLINDDQDGQISLRKGKWTPLEDADLVDYVTKHGEGEWLSVQEKAGIRRSAKSCRVRWMNHLRPNLKKGGLTSEEKRLITDLHTKLGNKWAQIAKQLPGRTDNDVKNYFYALNRKVSRAEAKASLPSTTLRL